MVSKQSKSFAKETERERKTNEKYKTTKVPTLLYTGLHRYNSYKKKKKQQDNDNRFDTSVLIFFPTFTMVSVDIIQA